MTEAASEIGMYLKSRCTKDLARITNGIGKCIYINHFGLRTIWRALRYPKGRFITNAKTISIAIASQCVNDTFVRCSKSLILFIIYPYHTQGCLHRGILTK